MSRTDVIAAIVDQHAEEAAFLWTLRERAIHSPQFLLSDLRRLDDRVEAHIDGLRVAGEAGWEICREQLSWGEPGELFAAGVLAFESGISTRVEVVLELTAISGALARGVSSALGWCSYAHVAGLIDSLTRESGATLRRIGIAAAALHGQRPQRLRYALDDRDDAVKTRALRAVGELGCTDLLPEVRRELAAPTPAHRVASAWSAGLAGDAEAIAVLERSRDAGKDVGDDVLRLTLGRRSMREARGWLMRRRRNRMRLAIAGAAALGDSEAVPWLIDAMQDHELARAAGEAFSTITGADLAAEQLEGRCPEGSGPGLTDDPADDVVSLDPDEDLPWPDRARVDAWWHCQRPRFAADGRYLLGTPITSAHAARVLVWGRQRQRRAAAIELGMLHPGRPLFDVRAPAPRQLALLGELAGAT